MNSRLLSLVALLSASQLSAHSYTTYTTHYHSSFSNQPDQRSYASMEDLAADGRLANNSYLLQQFINYVNTCRYSERHPIFFALAQNPTLTKSSQLASYLSNYLTSCAMRQREEIVDLLLQRQDVLESYELENAIAASLAQSFGAKKQALIVRIAGNPYLVQSNRLFAQVTAHLDQCWNSVDKSELLRTLAANPSVYNNYACSHIIHTHIQQQDPDLAASLFAGALVGFAAGTVLYNLFFEEPTVTRTTTYTTYTR